MRILNAFNQSCLSFASQELLRVQGVQAAFKPLIVWLILNGKTEEALERLAEHYEVNVPKLKIGLPKGRKKRAYGCYTPRNATISVLNSDVFGNPFVILHEFYHHLRTHSVDKQHRGTEKNADKFAAAFLQAYEVAKRMQSLS
jgi:Zn-dependent peptidase ImmA (M78 family)